MSQDKIGFEETLGKKVVATERCFGCGACVVVCPFGCLEYEEEKPKLATECKVCGICTRVCPQYEWSLSEVENFVFGRERKVGEEFGAYRRLVVAQAQDEKIREVCQDGGVVTALLTFALENNIVDAAAVSGISQEKPFHPIPRLVTSSKEIIECAGTRYTYSPNIFALAEGVKQKKTSIAFVGTPCQIRALRKIQMSGFKKYAKPLSFLIGLLCSEAFTYEGLMEKHINATLGLSLKDIKKMNIKGKMMVTTKSDVKTISLKEIKQYTRKGCGFCEDFSSELADISVGGLGLNGWTFTIIRTEKGEKLFTKAEKSGTLKTRPVDRDEFPFKLLLKLSRKKRDKSHKPGFS